MPHVIKCQKRGDDHTNKSRYLRRQTKKNWERDDIKKQDIVYKRKDTEGDEAKYMHIYYYLVQCVACSRRSETQQASLNRAHRKAVKWQHSKKVEYH